MRQAEIIAHRGASSYAPEHTFAAYDLALAMGADALELDLRSTADGVLVVCHDPTLARTAGDPRPVVGMTADALAGLPPDRRPLTLDEVFARYGTRTGYWLDVKDLQPAGEDALIALIARHGLKRRVGVQSFDHLVLRRIRRLDRELPVAALYRRLRTREEVLSDLGAVAGFASGIGPHAGVVDAAVVLAAHARGLAIRPFTVNAAEEADRLLGLGVDALITDVPDRVLDVLAATPALALAG